MPAKALCLGVAGAVSLALKIPGGEFVLSWAHSVEKVRWDERYAIRDRGLELIEARIQGNGAGMQIPDDARLEHGAWVYRPRLPPFAPLRVTRSGYADDYRLCANGQCRPMRDLIGPPPTRGSGALELWSCNRSGTAWPPSK